MLQVPGATSFIGCIGKDKFGEEMKKHSKLAGVNVRSVLFLVLLCYLYFIFLFLFLLAFKFMNLRVSSELRESDLSNLCPVMTLRFTIMRMRLHQQVPVAFA